MQVPNVHMQHNVMIETIENHMPEAIIIDEIGTELEAFAVSTIAQCGVQLVGTANGMTIDNIIKNPSLQILVGGIESVTLGDEEARKRKVQKTILERKGPPTFTCAVEMITTIECPVHHRLDAILGGDVVEVFQDFSWKTAAILKVLGSNHFMVKLIGYSRELLLRKVHIRVRQFWQDGEWILIGKGSRNQEASKTNKLIASSCYPKIIPMLHAQAAENRLTVENTGLQNSCAMTDRTLKR
ncbi:protein SEEDLING PLASTID DEVELOPMENT 1-like isoform X1 [Euphorbia lathyris]|uniref:protein SEEDLING PLASTID DEVELOPMENT 1-like isoform X1 n=2 Tax=Euphorbia lathyris TaxID=212925 RepID=UPI00331438E4